MAIKVEHAYIAGNDRKKNEDAFVINENNNIFAAIDGATGLIGTPGHLASYTVKDVLEAKREQHLFDRIPVANEIIASKTLAYVGDVSNINEIEKSNRSSTGIAAIQLSPDEMWIDYVHAGDCMLFLQYENGDIRMVTYDLIQYLDDEVLEQMSKLRQRNPLLSLEETRELVKNQLIANRNCLNTKGGYGVLDGSEEAIHNVEKGTISLRRVQKILLLSDGYTFPVKTVGEEAWGKSARIAFEQGLQVLTDKVLSLENSDSQCVKFPRFKKSDDKTAVLITIDHENNV